PVRRGSGYEGRSGDQYDRNRYGREAETRSLLQRIEDEIKSWFGDEDAERRRRADEMRSRSHAGRGPRNYRRSDDRIREDLNERLTEDPYLDASNIEIAVESCVVTMTGTVNSRYEKRRAADLAESISGVTDINNQLRVNQNPSSILPELNLPTQTKTARG
ncbi:MAG TPA: BON domain-containing protein, partial [Blastocatellia bacterium]|nr:BON domain-containing protein [Blastocatellia bacterium]